MSKSCHSNHSLEKVYSSRTCHIFPCTDLTCLEHYTEEGDSRVYDAQAVWDRDGPRGKKYGGQDRQQEQEGEAGGSKDVILLVNQRVSGVNIGHGLGQNCPQSLVFTILYLP